MELATLTHFAHITDALFRIGKMVSGQSLLPHKTAYTLRMSGFCILPSLLPSVTEKFKLANLTENMPLPPYEPARLVNGDQPLTKEWYIVFYAWNAQKGKLERKRDYKVNKFKTKSERLTWAKREIKEINSFLEQGYHIDPILKKAQDSKIIVETKKDFTIEKAIKFILPIIKQTKSGDTYTNYKSVSGMFLDFCINVGWDQWKIKSLTQSDVVAWLDHIQVKNKLTNTARNNYKGHLSAVFTMLKERGSLDINAVFGIKGEKEAEPEANIAFTLEQIEKIKPVILAKSPRLWSYITFILYGFIRPSEIARLRVKMVDLKKNEMFLPGKITKNGKNKRITIGKHFRKYIVELNLDQYSGNHYIFGHNLITGDIPLQRNYAASLHRKIIEPEGFGENYGPYSWKHTGVILHYIAGIDIKTLQAQIGHQSLEETDIYLRSLGLYANNEIQDKSPAI